VNWVEIDVGKDAEDFDHPISPEERLRLAMAIQGTHSGPAARRRAASSFSLLRRHIFHVHLLDRAAELEWHLVIEISRRDRFKHHPGFSVFGSGAMGAEGFLRFLLPVHGVLFSLSDLSLMP